MNYFRHLAFVVLLQTCCLQHRNSDKCCCMQFPSIHEREKYVYVCIYIYMGFPGNSAGKESTCKKKKKESTCNAGNPGSIPGCGRSSGEGIGYPLQYSWASPWLRCKESACNAGDLDSIPGLGRSPEEGKGYPL